MRKKVKITKEEVQEYGVAGVDVPFLTKALMRTRDDALTDAQIASFVDIIMKCSEDGHTISMDDMDWILSEYKKEYAQPYVPPQQ